MQLTCRNSYSMSKTVKLFSETYSPSKLCSSSTAALTESLWRTIMDEQTEGRAFLRIEYGGKEWFCPVGQPITEDAEDALFLPNWMIDCGGFMGTGELCTMTVLTQEAFPEATKLVLKVVDSAFYNSEIKEELETALSSLGVVKQHTLLQIPIQNLGGFQVEVFVSKTEPADLVLCSGEEVVVEFEEPVDHYEPPPKPPTPIPPQVPILPENIPTGGFVAFQGEGRTLGGSPAEIPEWRKECPPKKKTN